MNTDLCKALDGSSATEGHDKLSQFKWQLPAKHLFAMTKSILDAGF